jgi:hypothetical protein
VDRRGSGTGEGVEQEREWSRTRNGIEKAEDVEQDRTRLFRGKASVEDRIL